MAMDVNEDVDVSAFKSLSYHFFHRCYLWRSFNRWGLPLSVQVKSRKTASIVTNNDTIRVEHRYDLKNISVS